MDSCQPYKNNIEGLKSLLNLIQAWRHFWSITITNVLLFPSKSTLVKMHLLRRHLGTEKVKALFIVVPWSYYPQTVYKTPWPYNMQNSRRKLCFAINSKYEPLTQEPTGKEIRTRRWGDVSYCLHTTTMFLETWRRDTFIGSCHCHRR